MKRILIFLIFLMIVLENHAQSFNPSSESMSYMDNKRYTVDYNTGLFHYEVPITTIELNDYILPVGLNYVGRSIKSNDQPGFLGYNWALSSGGVVSRIIKGLPDELNEGSSGESILGSLELKKRGIDLFNKDASDLVDKHEYDGEHDIFTATFNGKTISFILNYANDLNKVVAEPLEQSNIKIECDFINNLSLLNSFRIIDEDGCEYIFKDREFTTSLYHKTSATRNSVGWYEKNTTSSWYLSLIRTTSGNVIKFKYKVGQNQLYNSSSSLKIQYSPQCFDAGSKVIESKLAPLIKQMETLAIESTMEVKLVNISFPFEYKPEIVTKYIEGAGYVIETVLTNTDDVRSRIIAEHDIYRLSGLIGNVYKYMDNIYELKNYASNIYSQFYQYAHNNRYPTVSTLLRTLVNVENEIEYFLSKAYVSTVSNSTQSSQTMYSIPHLLITQITSPTYCIDFECIISNSHSLLKSATLVYPPSQFPLEQVNFEYDEKQQFLKKVAYLNRNGQMYNSTCFCYYKETAFTKNSSDFWGDNTKYAIGYDPMAYGKDETPYYPYTNNKDFLDSKKSGILWKIVNLYGGEIEIDYEDNTVFDWSALKAGTGLSPKTYHGGLRIKSLALIYGDGTNDKIEYSYPHEGHLLAEIRTHIDCVSYKSANDIIESSQIFPQDTYLNIGNNGVVYNCVLEKTIGGGSTAYYYKNPDPIFDFYESWIVGKLIYKVELDKNEKVKSILFYNYTESENNYKELNEIKASEYYVSEEDAAKQIENANNVRDELAMFMFNKNIWPRTEGRSLFVPSRSIIHYGKKLLLKKQKEYQFEEPVLSYSEIDKAIRGDSINGYYEMELFDLELYLKNFNINLVNHKEFYYDNHNVAKPTRVHSYQSNGDIRIEKMSTPLDYNGTDAIINEMKAQNIVSPVLNKQTLIKHNGSNNYELVKEDVTSYNKFNNSAISKSVFFPISLMESVGSPGVNISSVDLSSPSRSNVMTLDTDKYRKVYDWSYAYKDNKFIINQLIKSSNRSFHFFNTLSNDKILEVFPKDDVTANQVDAKNVFCYYDNNKPSYPLGYFLIIM